MTSVWTAGLAKSAAIFSARDWVRLATRMEEAPCSMRWRAASSDILPAPTRRTVFPCERAEDLSGEVDGYGGDGDGAGADLGFGADFFGDGEGALEEGFEVSGDGADFAGDGVGLFDLAEDLGLAYDHAVERAGDAEEVADGFALAEFVEVGLDVGGRDGEVFVEEAEEVGCGLGLVFGFAGVVLQGEEFDAVAGGEDEAFADAGLMEEGAGGVGEAARRGWRGAREPRWARCCG